MYNTDTSNAPSRPVVSPPELFSAILRFNFLPAGYMDVSWWQSEWPPSELRARLHDSRRAQRRLSQIILHQFELTNKLDFDFAMEKKHLALLAPTRLLQLVKLAGLTLQIQRIARAILRQDREAITDTVGESDYRFALKRAPQILREANVEPVEATDDTIGDTRFSTLEEDCRRFGYSALAAAMQGMPMAFSHRLQLKFPRTDVERYWRNVEVQSDNSVSADDNIAHFFMILNREVGAT